MNYSNNLSNTLILRESCRNYKPNKFILPKDLDLMYWAAHRAPYASGGPRFHIDIVVNQNQKNEIMAACMDQKYVGDCSAVVIFSGKEPGAKLRQGFSKFVFDCSMACMCFDLMATSLDYGTCVIGNFIPDRIKEIIGTEHRPTIILLVGYPV